MSSLERTIVSRDDALTFMRLATAQAAAAQIGNMFSDFSERSTPAMLTWLDAALEMGHFDLAGLSSTAADHPLKHRQPANEALGTMLKSLRNFRPEEKPWVADAMLDHRHVSKTPAAPAGIEDFVQRLAQHLLAVRSASGGERLARLANLRTVLACAVALDQVDLVAQLHPQLPDVKLGSVASFIPLDMVLSRSETKPPHLLVHPGTLAIHYGADRVLKHFLDDGWQVASHAGWSFQERVDDGSFVDMPEVLRCAGLRLNPASLALVLQKMNGVGLVERDVRELATLTVDLADKGVGPGHWGRFVLSSGLAEVDPWTTYLCAASHHDVDVLEAFKDRVSWSSPAWSEVVVKQGHPAVRAAAQTADGNDSGPNDADRTVAWFLQRAQALGPQALQALFAARDLDGHTLAQHLVRNDRAELLRQALELGLDPLRSPDDATPSALETASLHGRHDIADMIRAHVARTMAREAALELAMMEQGRQCAP